MEMDLSDLFFLSERCLLELDGIDCYFTTNPPPKENTEKWLPHQLAYARAVYCLKSEFLLGEKNFYEKQPHACSYEEHMCAISSEYRRRCAAAYEAYNYFSGKLRWQAQTFRQLQLAMQEPQRWPVQEQQQWSQPQQWSQQGPPQWPVQVPHQWPVREPPQWPVQEPHQWPVQGPHQWRPDDSHCGPHQQEELVQLLDELTVECQPEPAKPEPAKPEPAKPEPAKPEPAKPEPAKPESAKQEPAKPEPAKPAECTAGTRIAITYDEGGHSVTTTCDISGAPNCTVTVEMRAGRPVENKALMCAVKRSSRLTDEMVPTIFSELRYVPRMGCEQFSLGIGEILENSADGTRYVIDMSNFGKRDATGRRCKRGQTIVDLLLTARRNHNFNPKTTLTLIIKDNSYAVELLKALCEQRKRLTLNVSVIVVPSTDNHKETDDLLARLYVLLDILDGKNSVLITDDTFLFNVENDKACLRHFAEQVSLEGLTLKQAAYALFRKVFAVCKFSFKHCPRR